MRNSRNACGHDLPILCTCEPTRDYGECQDRRYDDAEFYCIATSLKEVQQEDWNEQQCASRESDSRPGDPIDLLL